MKLQLAASKKIIRSIRRLAFFGLASLACIPASASIVNIDFENQALGSRTNNFSTNGFNFSPSCHYDLYNHFNGATGVEPTPNGNWIGFDNSGCYDAPGAIGYNGDFLGVADGSGIAKLFVAATSGETFSLKSFIFVTIANDTGGYTIKGSSGASQTFYYGNGNSFEYALSGPQWENLNWLEFSGGGPGVPAGFDNLTLEVNSVDEPGSLALASLALFIMSGLRRIGKSS